LLAEEAALLEGADGFDVAVAAMGEDPLAIDEVGAGGEAAGGGEWLRALGSREDGAEGDVSLLRAALAHEKPKGRSAYRLSSSSTLHRLTS
jgi:hypothetical protein